MDEFHNGALAELKGAGKRDVPVAKLLDALNLTNFFLANAATSASFGTTRTAFRDFSGTNDPGARIIEFQLRVNF